MIRYIGDSNDVRKRINGKHSTGNVKVSALREIIAGRFGFKVIQDKVHSKYTKKFIQETKELTRKQSEKKISEYIQSGMWKFVACSSKEEATQFQYYAIKSLSPKFNRHTPEPIVRDLKRFEFLLENLLSCEWQDRRSNNIPITFGVYIFGHVHLPILD